MSTSEILKCAIRTVPVNAKRAPGRSPEAFFDSLTGLTCTFAE
jgi:hypothetical protein